MDIGVLVALLVIIGGALAMAMIRNRNPQGEQRPAEKSTGSPALPYDFASRTLCDVCGTECRLALGFALTTRQVALQPSYWRHLILY